VSEGSHDEAEVVMRHAKTYRKFSRTPSHRRAMFRNMATSLFLHERLETTVEKAKDLRSVAEKLITLAGTDTLHARRLAYGYVQDKSAVRKLFDVIGPRFKDRTGGYTRVVRTRVRPGDAAELAVIELVSEEFSPKAKKAGSKKASVLPLAAGSASPVSSEAPAASETETAAE
jgi:large subunit ribosomal protein L17